jgi:hypothetical protein
MAIIIKRNGKVQAKEPDALVDDAPAVPAAQTNAERVKDWKDNHPPIDAQKKQCAWCKQWYLQPCATTDVAISCANYLHLRHKNDLREKEKVDVQSQI